MKRLIITLTLLTSLALLTGCFGGGGGSDQTPQQQLQQAQQQLLNQQASTANWQLFAAALGVGCILLFIIGAMLGSRTRRNAKRTDNTDGK